MKPEIELFPMHPGGTSYWIIQGIIPSLGHDRLVTIVRLGCGEPKAKFILSQLQEFVASNHDADFAVIKNQAISLLAS